MSWKICKLGDISEFIRNGKAIKQSKDVNGLPITRIETIWNSSIDTTRVGYAGVTEHEAKGYLLEPGDILFSHINSLDHIGKCALYAGEPTKLVHGMNLLCIRPKKKTVSPKFLIYLLRTNDFNNKLLSVTNKSVNQASVSTTNLKGISISLPPLEQQKRIAAILDKTDELRAKRRRAIAKLDELLKSVFLEMFGDPVTNPRGWDTVSLNDLITDGPQNGLYRPASDYGSGTPIIRIDSFYKGKLTGLKELKRVRLEPFVRAKYEIAENDILINRVNSREYLGKSALVPKLSEPTIFESNMMRFSVDVSRVRPQFLVSLLQHAYMRNQIIGRAKDAVNQSSINQGDVKSFEVRLPPLAHQVKYVSALDYIEGLRTKGISALGVSQKLFDSLQAWAFSGDLTPDALSEVERVETGAVQDALF